MLPFTIPFFIYMIIDFDLNAIKYLACAMLIWNFFFGIFENNYFDYENNKALVEIIKDNPDKIFILKESNLLVNQYYYEIGTKEYERLIDNNNKEVLSNLILKEKVFYTDVLSKKVPFNRVDIVSSENHNNIVFIRHIQKINSALGEFYVDEVELVESQ